jgi:hypothetical protein
MNITLMWLEYGYRGSSRPYPKTYRGLIRLPALMPHGFTI